MKEELMRRHPKQDNEDEGVWKKAINARSFDVMRAFLPTGATTNLAWHGTLRQIADHLLLLRNHKLDEVREVGVQLHSALDEMYPNSFKQKIYPATESYVENWMAEHYYYFDDRSNRPHRGVVMEHDGIDRKLLQSYSNILTTRPPRAEMPKIVGECGTVRFSFLLDFGSFRDVQRHRPVVQRMPLLTTAWGFGSWYLEQMPPDLRHKAQALLVDHARKLEELDVTPLYRQYYIPMGYQVLCRLTGDLPALSWLVELRSGISVHATLRTVAQDMGSLLLHRFGDSGLTLHIDRSEDRFNYKRGTQDIVEKKPT